MRKIKKRKLFTFVIGGLIIAGLTACKLLNIITLNWIILSVIMGWTVIVVDFLYFHFKLREIEKWNRHIAIKRFKDDWDEFQSWKKNKK